MNDAIKNLIEQAEALGQNVEAYIEGELRAESDPRQHDGLVGAQLELNDALWDVIKLLETL